MTCAQMKTLLLKVFGPTTAVNALAANNNAITTAQVRDYIRDATGVVGAPPANVHLNTIVAQIEAAEQQYTRQAFVTALRDALAHAAAIATPADIETWVTKAILSGKTLAELSRGNRPVTRGEAGAFIAAALGWTPISLQTVVDTEIGGHRLMALLDGELHADKVLPQSEADSIIALVRALTPRDIFSITRLYLADGQHRALPKGAAADTAILGSGSQVSVVAQTRGISWPVGDQGIQFTLTKPDNTVLSLAVAERVIGKMTSQAGDLNLIQAGRAPRRLQLNIVVTHATAENTRLTLSQNVTVYELI